MKDRYLYRAKQKGNEEWINTKNTWEQCAYEESACMKKLRVNGILRWLRSEAE